MTTALFLAFRHTFEGLPQTHTSYRQTFPPSFTPPFIGHEPAVSMPSSPVTCVHLHPIKISLGVDPAAQSPTRDALDSESRLRTAVPCHQSCHGS